MERGNSWQLSPNSPSPFTGEGGGGGVFQRLHNCFNYRICITQHVVIPETQHTKILRGEPFVALLVFLFLFSMLSTIDLYDQSCF